MKLIASKLDNGYTLTIVEDWPAVFENGELIPAGEKKQRLVFESKDALLVKMNEVL